MQQSVPHPTPNELAANPLAGSSSRAWSFLVAVVVVSIAIDLATKYWAFHAIADAPVQVLRPQVIAAQGQLWNLIPAHTPVTLVPKVLDFTLVLNPGAVFGIGAGKRWFFVLITFVAVVVGTIGFARFTRAKDWSSHLAIGLILGGGLGNLYDRLIYACVRDFLHPLPGVKLPFGWSWPWGGSEVWPYVSNVADAFLIVGVVMLAWKSFFPPPVSSPVGSLPVGSLPNVSSPKGGQSAREENQSNS
jgi:signal peptidase II